MFANETIVKNELKMCLAEYQALDRKRYEEDYDYIDELIDIEGKMDRLEGIAIELFYLLTGKMVEKIGEIRVD